LYYYRARYYDPHTGRFLSEDPIGFAAGDSNLSRYVENGPTNWVDPTGLDKFIEQLTDEEKKALADWDLHDQVLRILAELDPEVYLFWKHRGLTGPRRSRTIVHFIWIVRRSKYEELDNTLFYGADECESPLEIALNIILATRTDKRLRGWQKWFEEFYANRPELLRSIQQERAKLAAQYAFVLASLYYEGIASITAAGDVIVSLNDFLENGFKWSQLVAILPLAGMAVTLRIGNKEIQLTDDVARALNRFDDAIREKYLRELADAASDADRITIGQRIIAASDEVSAPTAATAGRGVAATFEQFRAARQFATLEEAQIAWRQYQNAAASRGLIIGTDADILAHAGQGGMVVLRMTPRHLWTWEINKAWLDGAIANRLPVRLITPYTPNLANTAPTLWREINYLINAGYRVEGGFLVPPALP
ncbi:MAG: RHS repeat-associated core domain-containing protein, partial [Bryobacteraceae bacterium]|nr:RHS repeat-associated core domain-containing protein [Bryobacteraceae bacterium]